MKQIFEEYGDIVLSIIGGLGVLAIIFDLLHPSGLLHELIVRLAESAC